MTRTRSSYLLAAGVLLAGCSVGDAPSGDGSAPQVRIDAPAANATVGGSVAIDVTAVDDIGVDKVRFLVDGNLINELFTPPFHTIWNTQALTDNTTHIIRIEALDVAQNLGSQQITVTVQNGVQAPPATPR